MSSEPRIENDFIGLSRWACVAFIATCGRRLLSEYENDCYESAGRSLAASTANFHAETGGIGVVEAKVGNHEPFNQSLIYPARWRVLLTQHQPTRSERGRRRCRYLQWRALNNLIASLTKYTWTSACGLHDRKSDRRDDGDRAQTCAEPDALIAHLDGLTKAEFAYILDTFPVLRGKEVRTLGEYQSERKTLEEYDRFTP